MINLLIKHGFTSGTIPTRIDEEPPEITAINLIVSPSFKISSSKIISPSRVAITDSGRTLIFFSESSNVMPGFTSYSFSRIINFTVMDGILS